MITGMKWCVAASLVYFAIFKNYISILFGLHINDIWQSNAVCEYIDLAIQWILSLLYEFCMA